MGRLGATGAMGMTCCTQSMLNDPTFAVSPDLSTWYSMTDPSIMCDPNCSGGTGTPAAGGAKSLIPGVSNGLIVGIAVAILIWMEFK